MKLNQLITLGFLAFSVNALADIDFSKPRECKIQNFVSAPYFVNEKPEIGATAYIKTLAGDMKLIRLQDLIDDRFVYFKNAAGKYTDNYLWLYSPAVAIPSTHGPSILKFYSASVAGDTIITISDQRNPSEAASTLVKYANTETGFMFSMECLN